MKTLHRTSTAKNVGMAIAVVASSFLALAPLTSVMAQKSKQPAKQEQSSSDSIALESAKKKFSDQMGQRSLLVSFEFISSQAAAPEADGYLPITDSKGNVLIKLSPEEQKSLRDAGALKPFGRPYFLVLLIASDGSAKVCSYKISISPRPALD